MALGDSFAQPGGILSDALDAARRPIREFMANLPTIPDPLGDRGQDRFANPFGANIFMNSLLPSGLDFVGSILPGAPAMPSAIAQIRGGQGGPSRGGSLPANPRANGPIARALEARMAPPSGTATHSATYRDFFERIGQEEGVPWEYLAALADTEASAVNAVSPAGARGLMQVVPGQGFDLPGENWADPATSIRQGARALKAKFAATGSWDRAVAAYFGYGTDAGGQTTQGYTQQFQQNLARIKGQAQQAPQAPAQSVPTPPPGVRPLAGLTVDQYGAEGLATGAADYICGPVAAQAFVRSQGRNPTLQEALDLARHLGVIDPVKGMHGIDSTVQLIRSLGGQATTGPADRQRIIGEIQAGRPVILNTPLHYFVVEGYDPATGKFDLGASARNLRSANHQQWFTLEEMANLTIGTERVGAPRGAIYAGY